MRVGVFEEINTKIKNHLVSIYPRSFNKMLIRANNFRQQQKIKTF